MNQLRATTHLADGANQMFDSWIEDLRSTGVKIDGQRGDDTALDADVVFACGLLTSVREREGQPLTVIASPIFAGETRPVYRSVLIAAPRVVGALGDGEGLRLAVNEYDSWSGWHGLKEHLRSIGLPASVIGSHVLTGGHVNSIDAVLDGRADIASIDHSVWNARFAVDSLLGGLRVLGTTRDWPAPPISIRSTLPDDVRAPLVDAIMAMSNVEPAQLSDYAFMLTEAEEFPTWP